MSGCASQSHLATESEFPAEWSGRRLYNSPGVLIYASSASAADELGRMMARISQDFIKRTGGQPTRGLIIVTDASDEAPAGLSSDELTALAGRSNIHPKENLTGETRRMADLAPTPAEMGIAPVDMALIKPLILNADELEHKLGFNSVAARSVAWAIALPTDTRIRKQNRQLIDAALKHEKVGLAQRILIFPFMPLLENIVADMVGVQRDIIIYRQLCLTQAAWDEPRRFNEAQAYEAAKFGRIINKLIATTQFVKP
jgi:hypothetical protein